ncbi:sensor domain-containing diguanylate cyclase [Aliikangiella sp. G2MR2-5]|uniref:sensor domain-containing diguanylate cyclase n=1 Tax=Aliikangiella sp. G2MR2-5 TaxID=2788943 RepID=UPI0018AC74A1|nr:sensor domain-containing diguanylate cyclase [Aliikangiella sp. G2MR2-5]
MTKKKSRKHHWPDKQEETLASEETASLMEDNRDPVTTIGPEANSAKTHNLLLQRTLNQLLDSAHKNQQTQEKFFQLELYFLQALSFEQLMSRLLQDFKSQFKVDQLELYLFDPDNDIRQLINEIYGQLPHINLHYCDSLSIIQSFYSTERNSLTNTDTQLKTTLTQKRDIINHLFTPTASITDSTQIQQSEIQASKSVALLPLKRGKIFTGSLHLGSKDLNRFSPNLATNFLDHLASIISVCIDNSVSQERFKHLSLVDMLTRTKNRRYFFQILGKEISRASRSAQSVSCLFLDIDHFKKINDRYGHAAGDRALKSVARTIQAQLRQSDTLARFGGEEFTVLLPNTDIQGAREIAERIRGKVEQQPVEYEKAKYLNLTLSIGVSCWTPDKTQSAKNDILESSTSEIKDLLVNQADKALYHAKENGRNQIALFSNSPNLPGTR